MSKVRVTEVSYEQFTDIEFKPPSSFFIKNALGEYVYFHTRSRDVAQEECDKIYGKGHYRIGASKLSKPKGDLTVTGTATRKK